MASTRSGRRKIQHQCRGDRRESRDETPGLEQGRESEREPRKYRAQLSRSSISAERTAGNSPGIHSWGSVARADLRSPESRRDGGGSRRLVFRRPYGTRLVDLVPSNPGLRLWLRPGLFPVVPTGLGGRAHPAKLFVHPRGARTLSPQAEGATIPSGSRGKRQASRKGRR